jgi:small subunit ribosomal protein S15
MSHNIKNLLPKNSAPILFLAGSSFFNKNGWKLAKNEQLCYISHMLQTKEKAKVIEKHRAHDKDTGSTEVQLALFSEKIKELTDHLKDHPKDNHSRRGLLGMVAKRRKLLDYLAKEDKVRYGKVVNDGYQTQGTKGCSSHRHSKSLPFGKKSL